MGVPVRSALYVAGEVIGDEARRAKVDQLYLAPRKRFYHNVLRLRGKRRREGAEGKEKERRRREREKQERGGEKEEMIEEGKRRGQRGRDIVRDSVSISQSVSQSNNP